MKYSSDLVSNREKLFEALLKEKGIDTPPSSDITIPKREKSDKYALSFAQQRLWFLTQFDPGSPAYNIPLVVGIKGKLSEAAVIRSINASIKRHEILRTVFREQDGQPFQVVTDSAEIGLGVESLSEGLSGEEIKQIICNETKKTFNLAEGPLIRAKLFKKKDDEHILVISMHHIITDGWSLGLIIKEFSQLYESFVRGNALAIPELNIQYADYALWQRDWLQGERLEKELGYWKEQLKDAPPLLELPTDFSRPPIQTANGSIVLFELNRDLVGKLKELSQNEGATVFMTLLAAYKLMLYRYTMQEDLVVGSPIAGRNHANTENLIGFFVNTLALRTQINGKMTFKDFLGKVKETTLNAYTHQNLPFEKLVEELNIQRNLSYSPLFQVMFAFQNAPVPELKLPGATIRSMSVDNNFSQFDVSATIWEENGGLTGTFEYNTDLFLKATIERMARHYIILLENIILNPDQRVSEISMLQQQEINWLLYNCNNTSQHYPRGLSIYGLFEKQARKTPDNTAVSFMEHDLTYAQLEERSGKLANFLSNKGVKPGDIVAVYTECSLEMMVGILGVLKAGGAYLPLDPDYPRSRIEYIIRDTGAKIVLTLERLSDVFSETQLNCICLDSDWDKVENKTNEIIVERPCSPSDTACIIYTSGSTGNPKGVILKNRGIVNLIASFIRSYNPVESDRVLPLTSVAAASFVGEIFPVICSGGCLVLAHKNSFLNFEMLVSLINEKKVTIISTVPSVMARLNTGEAKLPGVRLILSGGEALLPSDIDTLVHSATIVNGYGLTETSICSTYMILDPSNYDLHAVIPIGKPIMNHRVYILDKFMNIVPVGCVGEIYIGGDGLAGGYLNNPRLTEERFIQNPLIPGETIYKTGDMACWLPDGNIKYVARADNQVKIRGFRIETGEIENALCRHENIAEAFVTAQEGPNGDRRLVAFIVLKNARELRRGEIRERLSQKLPDYMIPTAFEAIDRIPLNTNGKVNVKLLPQVTWESSAIENPNEVPRTKIEKIIVEIWREVLKLDTIGIHDNFFDLGGHSLLITQIHSKLSKRINRELSIVDFFKYPTVRTLAEYISGGDDEDEDMQRVMSRAKKQREAMLLGNRSGGKKSRG